MIDGELVQAIHVPGYRLLVHPPYQRTEYPVYTLNERMVLLFATSLGPCVVMLPPSFPGTRRGARAS